MLKNRVAALLVFLFVYTGCGPETIFLRPSLDTLEQHLANGQVLLEQGKYHHALREFKRANELAPGNLDSLLGLGIAQGHCETIERGMSTLKKAEDLVTTPEEQSKLLEAYATLKTLRQWPAKQK